MIKPEQDLLTINPYNNLQFDGSDQLQFIGPFNIPVVSWIRLTNNTDQMVYFKLKTTAPKRYCVRPNSGSLTGKAYVDIQVLLQPFAFNPAEKNKHKFMIQSVLMPEPTKMSNEEFWKSVNPDKVINYKLKCVFALPESAAERTETEQEQTAELVKQPPPPKVEKAPYSGLGGELQKAAAELVLRREEESKLKHENMALKEEIARMRQDDNMRHSYVPPAVQPSPFGQGPITFYYIAISIAVAFVALLFGKYVL